MGNLGSGICRFPREAVDLQWGGKGEEVIGWVFGFGTNYGRVVLPKRRWIALRELDGRAERLCSGSVGGQLSDRVNARLKMECGEERMKEASDPVVGWDSQADSSTYAWLLRRCGNAKALTEGRVVHARIIGSEHRHERYLLNLLLHMYGKCGSLQDARAVFDGIWQPNVFSWNLMAAAYAHNGHVKEARCVFDKMPRRDVVSWTTMIAAYAQNGHGKDALQLLGQMKLEGVKPDKITFVSGLDACASIASLDDGKAVHASIVACGLESDITVENALVNMYAKCGSLKDASSVFDRMPQRNVVSWTAMIAAHTQNGNPKVALQLFRQMHLEGVKPDRITFIGVLDACTDPVALEEGKVIHAFIVDRRFHSDVVVGNALITMYGKCGSLVDARSLFDNMAQRDVVSWTAMIAVYAQHGQGKEAKSLFDEMPQRDVASWNAMIAAYAQNGHSKAALELFQQMYLDGITPDKITFVSSLDACAALAALEDGRMMHASILDSGFGLDGFVGNALVNMYGKCGSLEDARSVFEKMPQWNVVSWNAMITAYAQNGHGEMALQLFWRMDWKGVKANKITFISILDACASLAALEESKIIHASIVCSGFESDDIVGTALVNLYGKCGSLEDARYIFDRMCDENVVFWTAMIAAYAHNGNGKDALELFQHMVMKGINPDKITFISILSACSHAGLLEDGWQCFVSMYRDHGIAPTLEHYGCMIALLGRAGQLDKAEDLIGGMPFRPHTVAWTNLLGACRIYGDVERGIRAAEHVFELDPYNAAPYVLLANIYATAGRWDDVANVRKVMRDMGMKKLSGCSYIEIKCNVHEQL